MDIKDFVSIAEDGTLKINEDGFRSALDKHTTGSIETFKKNSMADLKTTIRNELEAEAKLSADEKLKKDRDDFEAYKKQEYVKLNQDKAKALFEGKGLSEKETEIYLKQVTDNADSLEILKTLMAEREKIMSDFKQKTLQELQSGQNSGTGKTIVIDNGKAEDVKKSYTADDIKNKYRI